MSLGVLVTDGQERAAVATCRALSAAGYRVGAAGSTHPAAAHWSRDCDRRFVVSDPRADDALFAQQIAGIVAEEGFDVVIPGTDAALLALSSHRGLFDGGLGCGLPDADVVDAAMRKAELHEKSTLVGLDSPETILCETLADARAASDDLGFPLLHKPPSSIVRHKGELRQVGSAMAQDGAALERRLAQFGFPCLLQRRDGGRLLSLGGVFADDRLLAAVMSRYRRTWPPDAGSVSFSETVTPPEPLLARVTDLLAEMRWRGIFELELIQSGPRSFAAIDFNPRVYGSLALAVKAGVPLPTIWCDWLVDGKRDWSVAPRGFHYRWEDAELCNLARHLREGRIRAAASMLRPRPRTAHALFRWNDPLPLLARALNLLQRLWRPTARGPEPATAGDHREARRSRQEVPG